MKINAYLISLSEGFKEIGHIVLKDDDFPCNKHYNKNNKYENISSFGFTYLWITHKFFPNSIIVDLQNKSNEKGYPDFLVYLDGKTNHEIYIEFKSESDSLSISQIHWNKNNLKKDRYLIYLKKDLSIY